MTMETIASKNPVVSDVSDRRLGIFLYYGNSSVSPVLSFFLIMFPTVFGKPQVWPLLSRFILVSQSQPCHPAEWLKLSRCGLG